MFKIPAHVNGVNLWSGAISYAHFVGNTYADAYAKQMAKKVLPHGALVGHYHKTAQLATKVLQRLLVIAQHACAHDTAELRRQLAKKEPRIPKAPLTFEEKLAKT